jgi:hypothetical protein
VACIESPVCSAHALHRTISSGNRAPGCEAGVQVSEVICAVGHERHKIWKA